METGHFSTNHNLKTCQLFDCRHSDALIPKKKTETGGTYLSKLTKLNREGTFTLNAFDRDDRYQASQNCSQTFRLVIFVFRQALNWFIYEDAKNSPD